MLVFSNLNKFLLFTKKICLDTFSSIFVSHMS